MESRATFLARRLFLYVEDAYALDLPTEEIGAEVKLHWDEVYCRGEQFHADFKAELERLEAEVIEGAVNAEQHLAIARIRSDA